MANYISVLKLPNNASYNLKDANAMPYTGGTFTGPVTFGNSLIADDINAGSLIVRGAANVVNALTTNGGLEIKGHIAGDAGNTGHGLYSGGAYHNAYNNIILHGDGVTGSSGIAFISDKGATNINQPSDRAFIQFHAYGISTLSAENTVPTLATSGENNVLAIGVGNDAGDMIYLQTPATTGLRHISGTSNYIIPSIITSTTTANYPVTSTTTAGVHGYNTAITMNGGTITAITFSGNATSATSATKATQDKNGKDITTWYASLGNNLTQLASGTDLNTIITPGNYKASNSSIAASLVNCPVTTWFFMRVGYADGATVNWEYQEIIQGSNGKRYYRQHNGGTWNSWTEYAPNTWTAMKGATASANGSVGYVNAVPPKDGYNTKFLRADGTWAVPAGGSGGGASIVKHTNTGTFTYGGNGSALEAMDFGTYESGLIPLKLYLNTTPLGIDPIYLTGHVQDTGSGWTWLVSEEDITAINDEFSLSLDELFNVTNFTFIYMKA